MIGELLIGGGLTAVGAVIGHFQGYLMGVKVRNLRGRIVSSPVEPQSSICICKHGKNTHLQRGTGRCNVDVKSGWSCACVHFVPRPTEKPKEPNNFLDLSK